MNEWIKTKGKYEIEKAETASAIYLFLSSSSAVGCRWRFRIEDGDDDAEDCEWPLFLSFISSNRKKPNTHHASGHVCEFTFLLEQSINSHRIHTNESVLKFDSKEGNSRRPNRLCSSFTTRLKRHLHNEFLQRTHRIIVSNELRAHTHIVQPAKFDYSPH